MLILRAEVLAVDFGWPFTRLTNFLKHYRIFIVFPSTLKLWFQSSLESWQLQETWGTTNQSSDNVFLQGKSNWSFSKPTVSRTANSNVSQVKFLEFLLKNFNYFNISIVRFCSGKMRMCKIFTSTHAWNQNLPTIWNQVHSRSANSFRVFGKLIKLKSQDFWINFFTQELGREVEEKTETRSKIFSKIDENIESLSNLTESSFEAVPEPDVITNSTDDFETYGYDEFVKFAKAQKKHKACRCLPSCASISYIPEISQSAVEIQKHLKANDVDDIEDERWGSFDHCLLYLNKTGQRGLTPNLFL